MQAISVPAKFPIPWANAAGGGFVRPIPTASQIGIQNGAASLTDGFPPLNATPIASGGVPPFMQDANGILKQITQWLQWLQAGAPVAWDSTFSSEISGYPQGAVVASATTSGKFWLSTADNNTSNPDLGGANWIALPELAASQTWLGTNTFGGATNFGGSVTANGAVSVNNILGVSGATSITNTLGVSGVVSFYNTLGVSGAASLFSTLGVSGATTLSSGLTVHGGSFLDDNVVINGNGSNYPLVVQGIALSTSANGSALQDNPTSPVIASFSAGVSGAIFTSSDIIGARFIAVSDGRSKSQAKEITEDEANRFVDQVLGHWYVKNGQWEAGHIAQQLLDNHFPGLVVQVEKDGMPETVNGWSGPPDKEYMVKPGAEALIGTALRFARKRIESLEARVAALEALITKLAPA